METLRDALRARFGAGVDAELRRPLDGPPVPSGWTRVDRALDGGLRPGRTALVEGAPGAGSLALASSWAREVCRRAEPVLVLDGAGSALPHAWVEPPDGAAPIWVLRVDERETWPALDIALRAGAFGLAVLLEPPDVPSGVGSRVVRLARAHGARMVVTRWPGRAPPWTPSFRIRLEAGTVRWTIGPTGAAPAERRLEVSCGDGRGEPVAVGAETRARDALTDRLHPAPRAPDRRPPSGRGGRTRRSR
ncbi:MAG TPA: hypothetical protein RMH99_03090 [Sandaracinaceae bacterium LLY-WYZ-13_1]|nr:hypothetical protein [Sandaracinaceae bacterium LLY-WYZ-13_1]